jgi:hypothetical protein
VKHFNFEILVHYDYFYIDTISRISRFNVNFSFFADAIQAVNPFLDRIPTELHADYINDFIEEFTDMGHVNTDGTVSADYRLMVAFAKKM